MRGLRSVPFLAIGVVACAFLAGCAGKAPPNGPGALNIAAFTLAQGAAGVPYRQLLIASGGVQPYTWSISSGSLPAGLTVTSDGIISGTPSSNPTQYASTGCMLTNNTFPITCNFAAQVVDSQLPIHAVDTAGLSITINSPLSLAPVNLGTATVGQAFATTITAANGVPPYTYTVAFGTQCTVNMQQTMCPAPGLTLSTVQPMNGMANGASISGMPTTAGVYTFTVQVTDSASPGAETATAVFTLTVVGRLQGPYAISFNGFDTSQPANSQAYYLVGQITAANDMNGSGTITGVIDQNGPGTNIGTNVSLINGTYNIPPGSNFGTITFFRSDNNVGYQFDVALSGTSSDSKLIQIDTLNVRWGSGLLKQQSTTSLTGGGSFTFGMFGTDPGGNRYAGAGAFALSSALAVTGGAEDTNDNGTLSGEQFITSGTFSTPNANGRGTATLMFGHIAVDYAYYVANANELIAVSTDAGAPMTLVDMLNQQAAGISGGIVLCKAGSNCQGTLELDGIAASGSSNVPEAEVGVASFSSCTGTPCAGNIMRTDSLPPYYVDQSVGGTYNSITYTGGTYSVDATCGTNFPNPCGRVTLNIQGLTNQPVWYLSSTTQAFIVGGDSDVLQGVLQPQAVPTGMPPGFSLPSLIGSYLGGTITPTLGSITNELDVAGTPPPGGVWNQMYETSGPGGSQTGLTLMGLYFIDNVNPTGTCNPGSGNTNLISCYGGAFGRFAICAPNTMQYCTSFTFDPNNPPVEIVYITGGASVGATGGKTGLAGVNLGVPQSNGTATLDPNPRLSTYGR